MNSPAYRMIIGLEVHVQLKTQSKLFCRCATRFGEPPNTQTCPVCLALPGALPVLNRQAIQLAAQAGLALGATISPVTKWDRKNYFYPDLPKGYQTSQFDLPICVGGGLDFDLPSGSKDTAGQNKRVRLIRAHLEEDAGKSLHDEQSRAQDTRIDLNRAGTPLLEIVTEPDMESAEEAKAFLTQLRLILTYLDVSDCNMQEGSLRVDANVNLEFLHGDQLIRTPITEIKNLNSFRAVERSLVYEASRQYEQFARDGIEFAVGNKQTRGWDDDRGCTLLQREKEESADYRYFPDPDLMPVTVSPRQLEEWKAALPELPMAIGQRYQTEWGLSAYDAKVLIAQGLAVTRYFEALVAAGATPRRASTWMQQDVLRTLHDREIEISAFPVEAKQLAPLLVALEKGEVESSRGKEVFQYLLQYPQSTLEQAIGELGIAAVGADELETLCRELLAQNSDAVSKIRDGNAKAIGSLVGMARKRNPNADPKLVQEICLRMIATGDAS